MKESKLSPIFLIASLLLGFPPQAHSEQADEITLEPDFFESPVFLENEEKATTAPAPEREGALAPLLKVLSDEWIQVTDGKPAAQWASGVIARRGANAAVTAIDEILSGIARLESGSRNDSDLKQARTQLEKAREDLKDGLKFSPAHRYSPALHSALISAQERVAKIEIQNPLAAESLYLESLVAEMHFAQALNSITLQDLKMPTPAAVTLSEKTTQTFDHIYAAARHFKAKSNLALDIRRRAKELKAKDTHQLNGTTSIKLSEQLRALFAHLKIQKEKIVETLKALVSRGVEEARPYLAKLTGKGAAPTNQCRALFKD